LGKRSRRKRQEPTLGTHPAPGEPIGTAHAPSRWRTLAVSALLVVAVGLVFSQLRSHEFLNYDDPLYVSENTHVQKGLTADGILWAFQSLDFNWHPITWISHMLDVQLFGMNPGAHLLMNAGIHAANAVLLFLLLTRMTGAIWRSAMVAALFAIHPLHVESVAWLAERKDVLSTLFLLFMLHSYLYWTQRRSKPAYALMVVFFALGLMSKGMVITAPFVLLLLDVWPLQRLDLERTGGGLWPCVREKLPLFLLVIPGALLTIKAQRAVSALTTTEIVPPLIRMANAAISYIAYLGKGFWPSDLALPYPYHSTVSPTAATVAAILLLAITGAAFSVRRRWPYVLVGWLWFIGTLVPVIGLIQIGSQSMADRYTYIPLVGIFIAVVWLVADLAGGTPALQPVVATAAVAVLVSLAIAARAQAAYWHDSVSLFRHAAAAVPDNYIAHEELGAAYAARLQTEEAIAEYSEAARIRPLALGPRKNLATLELSRGNTAEAAKQLQIAVRLSNDPQTQGALLVLEGRLTEAVAAYERALKANPSSADVHNDLAAALARSGRDAEAARQYESALQLDPSLYDAHMNYGALLSRTGRNSEAISQFRKAAEIRPSSPEPLIYLALVEASMGRIESAIDRINRAMTANRERSNQILTNAVHMPFKETNIDEYLAFLYSQKAKTPDGGKP
jgi:Flp pilus assembly protein TadD